MKIKDLKPGMKVWIRKDLKTGEEYGGCYFVEGMQELTGLQTIESLDPCNCFTVKEDAGWLFAARMIDWEKTKKLNRKFELTYDGTTLEGQIDGQEMKVVRSDKDKEDLEKAVMMALLKSLGVTYVDVKDLKNKVKKVWKPKYREKYYYIMDNLEVNNTYNDDYSVDKNRIQVGNCFETVEEAERKVIEVKGLFRK